MVFIIHRFYCTKSAYMMNFLIDLHTSLLLLLLSPISSIFWSISNSTYAYDDDELSSFNAIRQCPKTIFLSLFHPRLYVCINPQHITIEWKWNQVKRSGRRDEKICTALSWRQTLQPIEREKDLPRNRTNLFSSFSSKSWCGHKN